jgi:hypothetical protein
MASACNPPQLTAPLPGFDPVALLMALLKVFSISLPQMPSIPAPAPFCPLD